MSINDSCLAELEKSLANNLFLKGAHPTQDDASTFAKFIEEKCVPDQDKYPDRNIFVKYLRRYIPDRQDILIPIVITNSDMKLFFRHNIAREVVVLCQI